MFTYHTELFCCKTLLDFYAKHTDDIRTTQSSTYDEQDENDRIDIRHCIEFSMDSLKKLAGFEVQLSN